MSSATVRLSLSSRESLRELSEQVGKPMQKVVEDAIELYRRRLFLEDVNQAYAALRDDAESWAELGEERAEWDATLLDGLDNER